jgi:arylsulfatase A-like enzyme
VTQTFGMDQGFQSFDEHHGTLEETAERARTFLDADDGRPVFLFVQTYRTHKVYDVSAEARATLGLEARSAKQLRAIEKEYDGLAARAERTQADRERMAEIARELESRYRGTVWDLDRGFARFFHELEARAFFQNGYLVFTSDHGEAFDEHGQIFHLGEVHEEQVRVPLFLYGSGGHRPGLRAERVDWPASLLDLAPTLAALVGAEADPAWLGTSLLDLAEARPIYAFQSNRACKTGSTLCVIDGGRKVIGFEDAAEPRVAGLRYAYELDADPGERSNVSGEPWPRELLERHRAALDAALRPAGALTSAATTAEELQDLEAMGYAGRDE